MRLANLARRWRRRLPKMAADPGRGRIGLEDYFKTNDRRVIYKWSHYFDIYEHHFARFRDAAPIVLEIGVAHGGSLQMWRSYFGPKARIIGCDLSRKCAQMREEGFEIYIGDQGSRTFWERVREHVPRVDILIDDGGHRMDQQRVTFEEMFEHIKDDGVYLCEDLHTSYRPKWGGGLRNPDSFVEHMKGLIDKLNAWHSTDRDALSVDRFTRTANSIHFYDSVVVVEKRWRVRPTARVSGLQKLPDFKPAEAPPDKSAEGETGPAPAA